MEVVRPLVQETGSHSAWSLRAGEGAMSPGLISTEDSIELGHRGGGPVPVGHRTQRHEVLVRPPAAVVLGIECLWVGQVEGGAWVPGDGPS